MPETQPGYNPEKDLAEAMQMLDDPKFAKAAGVVSELPKSFAPAEDEIEELDPDDLIIEDDEDDAQSVALPGERDEDQSQVA